MGGIHALIGVGEGLITIGALAFLWVTRRDLVQAGTTSPKGRGAVWVFGLAFALALAVLSPLASANPDGLEWVAEQQGFLASARGPVFELIPDYVFPGISNEALATIAAGIVGTLLVLGVVVAVGRRRRGGETT
jgi:cobalt/nickel transport system permease protein